LYGSGSALLGGQSSTETSFTHNNLQHSYWKILVQSYWSGGIMLLLTNGAASLVPRCRKCAQIWWVVSYLPSSSGVGTVSQQSLKLIQIYHPQCFVLFLEIHECVVRVCVLGVRAIAALRWWSTQVCWDMDERFCVGENISESILAPSAGVSHLLHTNQICLGAGTGWIC
jgi:hypothetical protein